MIYTLHLVYFEVVPMFSDTIHFKIQIHRLNPLLQLTFSQEFLPANKNIKCHTHSCILAQLKAKAVIGAYKRQSY